jgi:3'-5' exoribonuclease
MTLFWQDDGFVDRFKLAPAAKKMHHAYLGGLLEHTLSLALLAERVVDHYGGIDRDLLLTGVMLHDIGKVKEFEYERSIEYSDEGRLISHIVIGIDMIEKKINQIEAFPEKASILLKHLIVSHHGSRELGSPQPPMTLEAVMLHYLDEIDSKVNGIREFMESNGTDGDWTPYHKLLERYFYKGK